jgi:hypothetical protein
MELAKQLVELAELFMEIAADILTDILINILVDIAGRTELEA